MAQRGLREVQAPPGTGQAAFIEGDASDARLVRSTTAWIREEFALAARATVAGRGAGEHRVRVGGVDGRTAGAYAVTGGIG